MAIGEMKGVAFVIWSFNRLNSMAAKGWDGSLEGMEVPLVDMAWAAQRIEIWAVLVHPSPHPSQRRSERMNGDIVPRVTEGGLRRTRR